MQRIDIPSWLRSIDPGKIVNHTTPEARRATDSRIRNAAIPGIHVKDVYRIVSKELPDTDGFKDFRRAWHKEPKDCLITGPAGSGKSTMAAWSAIRSVKDGGFVEWLHAWKMPEYLTERKRREPRAHLHYAERAGLCVIDDLHKLSGSWESERMQLSGIIHTRHATGLPTILCSTHTKEQLSALFGADTMDRFQWVFETEGSLRNGT